ncbi:MAG: zinc metalloprotease HtpX [Candidatus Hermodarchaeota archaeon]
MNKIGLRLSSTLAILALFALVYAIVFTIGIWFGWSLWLMVGITIGIVFLQYIFSPLFISWIYPIEWIPYEQFKSQFPHLAEAVDKVVAIRGIKTPRLGIIRDGNPNAFTYGWTKNSARIVITTGILEYLNKEEQKAVVSHELGHVVHNDFILMTIVFAIPLVLLTIARWAYYASWWSRGGSNDKEAAVMKLVLIVIAVFSYITYFIGYLISLIVSRIREYYADEHAGELTENPNALSTALVKIAYGLLIDAQYEEREKSTVRALRGLGIFDPRTAVSFAATTMEGSGKYSKNSIQAAAGWDIFNPWAKYYQSLSTHPLPAKRIMRLNEQCETLGIIPEIDLSNARKIKEEQVGKSMLDEFLVDLTIKLLPGIIFIALIALTVVWIFGSVGLIDILVNTFSLSNLLLLWALGFYLIGFGFLVRTRFIYKSGFEPKSILELITNIKVSPIRTIPAVIEGRLVGRGIPGFFLSEDLYLQDSTGLMYVDYRFGLGIVDFFFAIRRVKSLIGQRVRIKGWYRRGPGPYLQVDTIETESGRRFRNYAKHMTYIWAIIAFIIGLVLFYIWYISI